MKKMKEQKKENEKKLTKKTKEQKKEKVDKVEADVKQGDWPSFKLKTDLWVEKKKKKIF